MGGECVTVHLERVMEASRLLESICVSIDVFHRCLLARKRQYKIGTSFVRLMLVVECCNRSIKGCILGSFFVT